MGVNYNMDNFNLETYIKSTDKINVIDTDLCICINTNGFYFSLIDNNYTLKVLGEFKVDLSNGITSIMSKIKNCFNSIDIRIFNFNSIRVVIQTTKNIFVPYKLFDKNKTKEYLRSVVHLNGSDIVLESISEKLDIVLVYATQMYQHSGIKILMPKAKFLPQHQVMAEYAFDISKLTNNTSVLYKRDKSFDLVVFKGMDFTFSNSFDYITESDLIYHILFVFDQLDINSGEINLLITGDEFSVNEKQILRKYIKNVSYANPMEGIRVGAEFNALDLQKYFLTLVK